MRRIAVSNILKSFCPSPWIVTSCLLLFASSFVNAQGWVMPVDGKVLVGGQKTAGGVITLFKNGQQLQQVVTTSNGKFSFELTPNAEYIIAITKPGFVTKKFKIVTANVPADRAEAGNFNPFEPDVSLFEMPTSPEIAKRVEAILSQPIAIYQYIPAENNFNYDEKYTQVIQSKLSELADLQKQVEKEMQDKAKNAAVEAQKQLETDNKYKAAIAKADKALSTADYPTAKTGYNEALGIKPQEAYPKQKLSDIDKLLANANAQKELDAKYQAAITKANTQFGSKDYAAAKSSYSEAAGIKPSETYPKQKIAEIDKILGDAAKQKELDEKYQAAKTKGDNAFNSKDYTTAKAGYTEAGGIKPGEAYPKQKLAEIDKLLGDAAKQKELDAKYQAAITKGDNAFNAKDYANAKSGYTEASGIKPNEAYPKTKLGEIDKLLAAADAAAKQKEIDDKYKAAVTKGDNAFNAKDYANAKSGYTEASGIKPNEAYPKQKLSEIDKLLGDAAKQKELDAKYQAAITKGDNAFNSKAYETAKSGYTEASGIKPNEAYPKTKLAEIDKLLASADAAAKQKEIDDKYKAAVTKGDNAFSTKDYATAKSGYAEANGIKPNEVYPKTKLAEIEKLLAAADASAKQKEVDEKYKAALAKGDNAFSSKDYAAAKSGYTEAIGIKPNEAYPKTKLAEIDKLLGDAAKQKDIDAKYQTAIAKGDNAFNTKNYSAAKSGYIEASGIKPNEAYPKTKLAEIDKLLASADAASKQKEIDDKYKAAVTKGDNAFSTKDYATAKSGYTEASGIKPNEAYPKTKLAEIDKLLAAADASAKQKEMDAKYQAAITKGDGAFGSKDYASAKSAYTEASGIKPAEQYPKNKIAEIEKLLVEMSKAGELDKQYKDLITKGDNLFTQKKYEEARSAYSDASALKYAELYPKNRIAEINKLLKDLAAQKSAAELDQKYKDAVAKGDKAFSAKDYGTAKSGYTEASGVKPNEAYPKAKLAEIEKILADASAKKELDEKYKTAVASGDKAFGSRDYTSAKSSYLDASSIKPNEQYPKQKLTEIDKLLAAKEVSNQKDQHYNELLAKGDQQFNAKDYINAKNTFTQALGIKSDPYPKQKLAEIEKIMNDMSANNAAKELEKNYSAAISRGDAAFKENTFSNAKVAYNEALTYKPNEQYPKDKLAEIEKIEKARESSQSSNELQAKYSQCIERGDKAFYVKDYMRAKPAYEEALSYKPNEKYPKQRLTQIESILKAALTAQNSSKEIIPKETKQKTPVVSEEEKKKQYQSELRSKYPAGVTEEEYNDNGKTILRRVVIREDFVGVYLKVTHNWGGIYCFRDNVPITESTFENETK